MTLDRLPAIFLAAKSTNLSKFTTVFNTGSIYPALVFSNFCRAFIKSPSAPPISFNALDGVLHSAALVSFTTLLFSILPMVSTFLPLVSKI